VHQILTFDNALNKEYTYDGVHLLGVGYEKWGKLIMPIIENY
jgi:lysophospholipase L1-like esterase